MLTLPKFNDSKLRIADLELDPSRIARSTTEFATHELPELIRRVDVPGRLETGMDAASDAIRTAVDRLPGQRRRSPWRVWAPGIAIVGVMTVIAITGWWMARVASSAAREMDREQDEDALHRGANEALPTDPEVQHLPDDMAHDDAAHDATAHDGARPLSSLPEFGTTLPV
ncbi:MAG TPA: hypothetical protein VER83_09135 [Candidatus Nanopelagicales bacterium]|nr:hypothetical protein [Candidatus Nanopelagicales bacterium]